MSPRQRIEAAGVWVAARLVRWLPLAWVRAAVGGVAGRLFDRGGKRVGYALTNLRIALPKLCEEERRRIARRSYLEAAWNFADTLRAAHWTDDEIRAHMSFEGLGHLDAALALGRGVILLVPHLGNFGIGALALPLAGYPVDFVARPMRNPLLWRRVRRQRVRTGAGLIERSRAAPQILRSLRRGRAVGIVNDQYSRRRRGVFVPFFGVRCSTAAGVATLALRTGAPVLLTWAVRDAQDHHVARIGPPIEMPASGERRRDIEAATAAYNRAYEEVILRHPEQYMWATRRFRHSPDLEREPYA